MRPVRLKPLLLACLLACAVASPAAATSLTLAWDPPTDGTTTGYIVFYGTAPGAYSAQIDVGLVTQRRVEGLAAGTTYYFAVRAYNRVGQLSDLSVPVRGTTPGTPNGGRTADGLTGSFRTNRHLDLAWLPAAGTPDGYRVEVGTAHGETAYSALTPSHAIAFDLTNLPAPTYFIRVRPVYGAAYGYNSEELVVSPGGTIPSGNPASVPGAAAQCVAPPGAPRQFSVTADGAAVALRWQPGAGESASGYRLQVGTAPGLQNVLIKDFAANVLGVTATATPAAYALRLGATNTCGTSEWGPETMLYVGVAPLPGMPRAVTRQVAGGTVVLDWQAPATGGPVTRYLIEAATPMGLFFYDTGTTATTFGNANTPPGRYLVTVRAGNATGFGVASAPVVVVVP